MNEPLQVYAIGSKCIISPGSEAIEGLITGIMIRPGSSVSYQCVWWDGRTRGEEWLEELEVCVVGEGCIQTIGFAKKKGEE